MTDQDQDQDPMIAFEQTRVADMAAFYRNLAELSEATTLEDLFAQEQPLLMRLRELSPTLISMKEALTLREMVQAMTNSCSKALGH